MPSGPRDTILSHDIRHNININHTALSRWPSVLTRIQQRYRLVCELTAVVIAKFIILLAFKYTLFGHPQALHMELPPAQVAQALLSVSALHPIASGNYHDK
ncbi:cytochrome oxidase putative small subunit CydP [Candidatus Vallotiella sp. (ex Adelges kitamiensis)]|uniref:cytochrome oxidase putative small subunit CydP n=1 Tax=Candidatus Vallotiella sp. (ex Adelges kitamiensis) TaxID=2864217 RepID=UPI001CE35D77|nr:cytochrome oxidase putative small subunit CydP [Candidatus Vallotia sp. (ex Adelges kitamiensis)]